MFALEQLQQKAAELTSLAADIAAAIHSDMDGAAASELFSELAAAHRQLELGQCLVAERVDRSGVWQRDGASASAVAHLHKTSGQASSWIASRLHTGRALVDDLPETREAWWQGLLGLSQATIIRKAVTGLDGELTAAMDAARAEAAPLLSQSDLARLSDQIRAQAAPEQAEEKARRDYLSQSLALSKTLDGRWRLDGWLDSEHGALLAKALEQFTAKPSVNPDGTPGPKVALRRALGLAEMARQALTHDGACAPGTASARSTVIVTIPHDDLVHQLGTGDLDDGGTIPAAAVRRLACDAAVLPLQYDSAGQPLDLGRAARLAGTGQRYTLIYRDRGCVFPGCEAKPSWCDVHHLKPWLAGGATDLANLAMLCRFHHHALHEGGWTSSGTPGKDLRFHPPDTKVRRR